MASILTDYEGWRKEFLDKVAERGTQLLKADIRATHYDSGNMYESCTWMTVSETSRRIITDPLSHTNGIHYAPIVRDGRGPIYPKRRKALKWYKNGDVFIRKKAGPYEGDHGLPGKSSGSPSRVVEALRAEIPNL